MLCDQAFAGGDNCLIDRDQRTTEKGDDGRGIEALCLSEPAEIVAHIAVEKRVEAHGPIRHFEARYLAGPFGKALAQNRCGFLEEECVFAHREALSASL